MFISADADWSSLCLSALVHNIICLLFGFFPPPVVYFSEADIV